MDFKRGRFLQLHRLRLCLCPHLKAVKCRSANRPKETIFLNLFRFRRAFAPFSDKRHPAIESSRRRAANQPKSKQGTDDNAEMHWHRLTDGGKGCKSYPSQPELFMQSGPEASTVEPTGKPLSDVVFFDGVCGLCNRLVQFL